MLGLLLSSANKWLKKYRIIAKTSPYYVFGFGTEDKVVATNEELIAPTTENASQVIFNYKTLTINEGATLTIANKPEVTDILSTPTLSPVVIMCSKALNVYGHLNMDGASTFKPAIGTNPDTSMFLGQKFIKGTSYNNGLFNSVDPKTYSLIKAYAANNIMNNLEVIHAGKGSCKSSLNEVYPAKGGMVVLYYNTLNNNGAIHANGCSVPIVDPSEMLPCYGGGTLIICAPVINIGIRGKITADGGRAGTGYGYGNGAVATLNTIPEQVSDNQSTTSFVGYIGSLYACETRAQALVDLKLSKNTDNKITLNPNVLTTYRITPVSSFISSNASVILQVPSGVSHCKCYIVNMSSKVDLGVYKGTSIFSDRICTVSATKARVVYYNNGSWSSEAEDVYEAKRGSISGDSKEFSFAIPTKAKQAETRQTIFSAELYCDNDIDLEFDATESSKWTSYLYLLNNNNFKNLKPSIYCDLYIHGTDDSLTHINQSEMVEINTKSTDLVRYTLINPLTSNITLHVGESFVLKYTLYYPPRFAYTSSSALKFYIGYNESAASEPLYSTITCPPCSNIRARGGAGLCIGVKLPEVV